MNLEKEDKLQEPSVTIDESFEPYFVDTFTPGEVKQQLRVGAEVLDTSTNPYFGDGSSGDLYIKAGETVSIASGVYNYYNFTIETTGILEPADTTNPFVIKVKGTTRIDGTIAFNKKDLTFRSATTIPNQLGEEVIVGGTGAGGSGGSAANGGDGGISTEGIGGGGGGGFASTAETGTLGGGDGGTGTSSANSGGQGTEYLGGATLQSVSVAGQNGGNSRGGAGAFVTYLGTYSLGYSGDGGDGRGGTETAFGSGQAGQDGVFSNLTSGKISLGGGGGGGGGRGKNGVNLILIANKLSGTGTINCSGSNGSNGGNGGAGSSWSGVGFSSGANGGGGGGGAGGAVLLAYEGDSSGLTISNTSGTGGTGGNNGTDGGTSTKIVKKLSELF